MLQLLIKKCGFLNVAFTHMMMSVLALELISHKRNVNVYGSTVATVWCPRPAFECFVLAECIGKFLILSSTSLYYCLFTFFGLQPERAARSGANFFALPTTGSFILQLHVFAAHEFRASSV
jgi:hypothetical protein